MITKERLLEILEKSKPEDKVSFYTEISLSSLIILNLIAVSLESVPSLSEKYFSSFLYFEIFSVVPILLYLFLKGLLRVSYHLCSKGKSTDSEDLIKGLHSFGHMTYPVLCYPILSCPVLSCPIICVQRKNKPT